MKTYDLDTDAFSNEQAHFWLKCAKISISDSQGSADYFIPINAAPDNAEICIIRWAEYRSGKTHEATIVQQGNSVPSRFETKCKLGEGLILAGWKGRAE